MPKQASLNLMGQSLRLLPEQIIDLIQQTVNFKLPKNYKNINRVVVSGSGGSNLAGRIMAAVFNQGLTAPLLINPDYEAPGWVDKNTLFVACSYSGQTEETLAAYQAAKKQKAKIVVLTSQNSNNKLAQSAARDRLPGLIFKTTANPAGQPRLGLGYSLAGLSLILEKARVLKSRSKNLEQVSNKLKIWGNRLIPEKSNNQASQLAHKLNGHNIIIVSGEFLAGNAHTLRNQICENSKNFADYLTLPDLNHFAMEGLSKPNNSQLIFLFFDSILDSPRVQKRAGLTKQVIKKNKLPFVSYQLQGKNKWEQSWEMLQLGAWLTLYLAELNKVDPLAIPWVDWFKKQLK